MTEENEDKDQAVVPNPPDPAPDPVPAAVAELTAQLAARDAEFGTLKEALAEKEALTASQVEELAALRTADAAAAERIAALDGNLTLAIFKYKERLQAANPELLDSMVTGDTIAELDASLESALQLVDKVKANIDEQSKGAPVPTGSPERTGPDLSTMSAKEKIAYAVGKEAS